MLQSPKGRIQWFMKLYTTLHWFQRTLHIKCYILKTCRVWTRARHLSSLGRQSQQSSQSILLLNSKIPKNYDFSVIYYNGYHTITISPFLRQLKYCINVLFYWFNFTYIFLKWSPFFPNPWRSRPTYLLMEGAFDEVALHKSQQSFFLPCFPDNIPTASYQC